MKPVDGGCGGRWILENKSHNWQVVHGSDAKIPGWWWCRFSRFQYVVSDSIFPMIISRFKSNYISDRFFQTSYIIHFPVSYFAFIGLAYNRAKVFKVRSLRFQLMFIQQVSQ